MAKRKGNQPNGKAQSANHGSHLQKKRDGGKPGKAVATKVAQLEVPEGYRPQRGKGNKRRRGKKLIASDNSNFNQTERELQQQTSTVLFTLKTIYRGTSLTLTDVYYPHGGRTCEPPPTH